MLPKEVFDICAITSLYYLKGIVDANGICSPSALEKIQHKAKEEARFMIYDQDIVFMEDADYIKMAICEMMEHKLAALAGKMALSVEIVPFKKELICLLDYLYKRGVLEMSKFIGRDLAYVMKTLDCNTTKYFTPEGSLQAEFWRVKIVRYLMDVRMCEKRIDTTEIEDYLIYHFELEEKELQEMRIQNERRELFLSSGAILDQRE